MDEPVVGCVENKLPQLVRFCIVDPGGVGDEWLTDAHLPTATEGLVQTDNVRREARVQTDEVILLLQLRLVGQEHTLIIDGALPILDKGQLRRTACGGHGFFLDGGRLERFDEPYDPILHFLRRAEHAVLIGGHDLLKSRILDAHLIPDAAIVVELPSDLRTYRKEKAGGAQEVEGLVTALGRVEAECA